MRTIVALEDFDQQESVFQLLQQAGIDQNEIMPCSYSDSIVLASDQDVSLFLIEMSTVDTTPCFDAIKNAQQFNPNCEFGAMIRDKDSDLILKLVKVGVDDIMSMPPELGEIKELINKTSKAKATVSSPRAGGEDSSSESKTRVIGVTSYKGGTGVSTMATNLAFALAESNRVAKKTILVDMAYQSNHCSLFLDTEPTLTIDEVCEGGARMESAYIFGTTSWVTDNLALLSSDSGTQGLDAMNQDDVQQALTLLTEAFDFVVVDVPTHSFDGRLLGTLEAASKIVLVSTLDIGSVRDTRIYMELLKNLNVDQSKIKLCINRYDSSSGLMTVEEVEKTFNYHVSYYFPNDYLTAVNAACAGQAIMEYAPTSVLAQTYEELAANMNQEGGVDMIPKASSKDTKAKKKGGFLSKLIKT